MKKLRRKARRRKTRRKKSLNHNRAAVLIRSAKSRARKKGLRFTLARYRKAIERRLAKGVCEMSGIPFDYSRKWGPYSPSFHQQKPGRGYHYSNLKIIAFGLNMALGSWSVGEAERLMIEAMHLRREEIRKTWVYPNVPIAIFPAPQPPSWSIVSPPCAVN